MAKFRALGRHTDVVSGESYVEGQEVESDKDLDVLFHNKFERVGEPTKPARDYREIFDSTGRGVMDRPEHQRRAVAESITGRTAVLPRNTPYDPDSGHMAANEERFAASSQQAAADAKEASQVVEDADVQTLESGPRPNRGERGGGRTFHSNFGSPKGAAAETDPAQAGGRKAKAGAENAETGSPDVILDEGGTDEGFDPKKYDDITEEFPAARNASWKVYHGEEGYVIVDEAGNPVGEPLSSKVKVRNALKESDEE
jgi:hypothetical protein